jgi:hypothetical protein
MKPFESRRLGIQFTGPAVDTFKGNLMPRFTRGADGSQLDGKENFQNLFGILFPATGGIFAYEYLPSLIYLCQMAVLTRSHQWRQHVGGSQKPQQINSQRHS